MKLLGKIVLFLPLFLLASDLVASQSGYSPDPMAVEAFVLDETLASHVAAKEKSSTNQLIFTENTEFDGRGMTILFSDDVYSQIIVYPGVNLHLKNITFSGVNTMTFSLGKDSCVSIGENVTFEISQNLTIDCASFLAADGIDFITIRGLMPSLFLYLHGPRMSSVTDFVKSLDLENINAVFMVSTGSPLDRFMTKAISPGLTALQMREKERGSSSYIPQPTASEPSVEETENPGPVTATGRLKRRRIRKDDSITRNAVSVTNSMIVPVAQLLIEDLT